MLKQTEQTGVIRGTAGAWPYTLAGVISLVLIYSAIHVGARLIASGNLGEDDPLEAILVQTLQLGYWPGQPALYDWLLWLLTQVTGPTALTFQLIKYGLLTAACGFIFAAARRVMQGDSVWALLAVESLALIYQISWRFHEGFTHQVGAMAAVAATFWAITLVLQRGRPADFVVFGVCAGLGLLTEQIFWVFLATMLLAAAIQPATRTRLFRSPFLLAAAIAALLALPYVGWLLAEPGRLAQALPEFHLLPNHGSVLGGIRRAFTEPVMYLAPLVFIYPLFFRRMVPTIIRHTRLGPVPGGSPDLEQLILHMTLLNVGALVLGALFLGLTRYPTHALMPLFLITAIWLTVQARRAVRNASELRRFVWLAFAVALVAFGARLANMYVLEPVCQICRWGTPYRELAEALKRQGFASADIIVADSELGGNLLRFLPQARVTLTGRRIFQPAAGSPPASTRVLLWDSEMGAGHALASFRALQPDIDPNVLRSATRIEVPWRGHIWKPDGYRRSVWYVADLPERFSSRPAGRTLPRASMGLDTTNVCYRLSESSGCPQSSFSIR